MNYDELRILSITTRMQKLTEILRKDALLIYRKYNAPFMNKWYPVIIILGDGPPMSLTELATELNYAHPYVIQLVNEIEEAGLIRSSANKKDGRKRMVSLTAKGVTFLKNILPFAQAMAKALNKLIKTENNLMEAFTEIDEQLRKESFYSRVDKVLENQSVSAY